MPDAQNGTVVAESWWLILFRHFTTIVAILASFWWLAVPRIEGFIQAAVNDRIVRVETALDHNNRLLAALAENIEAIQATQRRLEAERAQRETEEEQK